MSIISGAALAGVATYFVWLIGSRSADPKDYFENRHEVVHSWVYPRWAVAVSCSVVLVEAVILWLVMSRARAPEPWKRALVCVALTLPPALFGASTLMHAPPFSGFHVLWLVSAAALSLFALLVSIAALGFARFSPTRRGSG